MAGVVETAQKLHDAVGTLRSDLAKDTLLATNNILFPMPALVDHLHCHFHTGGNVLHEVNFSIATSTDAAKLLEVEEIKLWSAGNLDHCRC